MMKFSEVAGINCRQSKKRQVTLRDLDLTRDFEWNSQEHLALTVFLLLNLFIGLTIAGY